MCNAWNHRPGCTCGWGGGYSSGYSFDLKKIVSKYQNFPQVPSIQNIYESYVNPNASCPVCGRHVYFYQSPYGGRVFFDELKPPWPKHSCTDMNSVPKPIVGKISIVPKEIKSSSKAWEPFIISSVSQVDQISCKVVGERSGLHMTVFVAREMINNLRDNSLTERTLANIKKVNDSFIISFLSPKGYPIEIRAFNTRKLV